MKPWRSLGIFGIVLVGLILILVAVKQFMPTAVELTPTPTPGPDPVMKYAEADVATVTILNPNVRFALLATKVDGTGGAAATYTWSVADPSGYPYVANSVSYLAKNLLSVSALTEVATDASDLASFGLAEPKVTLTLRMRDGATHVLKYGDLAPGGSGYYVMLDDTRRICIATSSYYNYAMQTPLDLIDKTVPINGMTAESVLSFELLREGDNADILAVLEGSDTSKTWQIKKPIAVLADPTNLSTLIGQVVAISPTAYVELAPMDLSKYGLDTPRYTLILKSATGEVTIKIGDDAGSGTSYALSSATPVVFKMSMGGLANIDSSLLNLINKIIYLPNIWEVAKIDIDIDGKHILAEIDTTVDQADESGTFKINGKDAKVVNGSGDSYFRSFYVSVISKIVERFELDATPADTADIRIAYTAKGTGIVTTLTFTKTSRDGYYVFNNGVYTGFVINRKDFYSTEPTNLGLLPAYEKLVDAMANAVDGIYATPTPAPTAAG
jgi:hypothetical protein